MSTQRYERIPVFTAGDRLRKARESAGMDQTQLSESTGISRSTVSHLELDKAPVKASYLKLWAMATGVPVEWLERGDSGPGDPGPGSTTTPDGDELARLTRNKRARHGSGSTRRYAAAA